MVLGSVGGGAPPPKPSHNQPSGFSILLSRGVSGSTPFHLITNAASLRLGHFLRHRFITHCHSFLKNIPHIRHVLQLEKVWHEGSFQFRGFKFRQWSCDACSATCSSCLYRFGGEERKTNYGDRGKSYLETSTRGSHNGRQWTNIILAINVLVYLAQVASQGKLLLRGAKINSLIDKGELWRLVTSSFLHANVGHLLVNCYSLNSVGPTMENISGPRRYLVVYITSAVASSAMSYWLSKAPAVGASGAIFGLVGSFAVFILRHNHLVKGGVGDLHQVARVIALNMVIGLLSQGIDNWGHVGGLIGGVATSWLIGPAWKLEPLSNSGRKVLIDRAPIFSLHGTKRAPR